MGSAQGVYPTVVDVGNQTTYSVGSLTVGVTYWFVVQAYDGVRTSEYSTPLQYTVPAPAPTCTYSISPTAISAPYAGTSGSITVTTQTGCAWSATSTSSFVTFQNGTGRTGSGTVTYTVAANTSTSARTGTATVAGLAFTVSQAAAPAPCTYSISPATTTAPHTGTTGSITVTTQTGCTWSATSTSSFLTFQNGTGRTGSGTVTYTVAANTSTSARTGTATVAGQAFSVSQDAAPAPCTYSISPATTTAPHTGTTGSITVTTQTGCAWSATSTSSFLTFQNGTGRTGSGTVTYTVAANTATSARTGTATVAGQAFSVSQEAAPPPCTYSISPATLNVSDAATSGSITVTTQTGCAWSATSASNFLTFVNGTGRTGSGTVTFNITANTSTSARTGTATVAGQAFSISQAAAPAPCTYSISPATTTAPHTGTTGSITVTTQTGCAWSATSTSSFLTFQNGTGRTGSGTVTFTVAANTATSARTGTATVAGQAFSVSQEAAPPPCTYSISPATTTAPDGGTTGSITVTTQTGCTWSATSASSFLTFQNGTGRTGSGTVTYTVAANTATSARTGTATVAGQAFSVSQAAAPAPCTYSISPATLNVSDPATSGTVTVTTQTGCTWSATSASSFLTFADGTGRTGSGTVTFNITANTGTSSRTGTATVAGQAFAVTQAAPPPVCSYSINPGSASAPAAGTTASIMVTTQPGCAWSASSANSFLTFSDGSDRTGSGTVNYVVEPNASGFRTATATVAGKSFTLWQSGMSCTFSISPASVSTSASATTGSVTVTTQTGCAWTATSFSAFVTFQDGTGRTGPGTMTYAIAENLSGARTASGLIAGVSFSVSQAGASQVPPPSPWSSDFDGDGKNDILVQHSVVGTVEAWFLDNATVKGTQPLSDTLDTNWMLGGRADFNGDGKPDLVWQHKTDGRLSIWYMNGTTRIGTATPSIAQLADAEWRMVGVGDFNADGRPDLAWQYPADGRLAVWLMDGTTVTSTQNLVPDRTQTVQWKVVGVADFNADGKSDLLLRNIGTGEVGAWLMNGLSRIIHSPLSPFSVPDQGWQVGAVVDANGDNKPDIVWQHTDGTVMIWFMNLTSRVSYSILPLPLPAGWQVVGPK